jgi:hypothetical protein
MADNHDIQISWTPMNRAGKTVVSAKLPDGTYFTDKVDLADAKGRDRFLRGLLKGRAGIDRKAVMAQLESIAAEQMAREGEQRGNQGRVSQADLLVELCSDVELFHTPGGLDSEACATVLVKDHKETWIVASKGFRCWLAQRFYQEYGKAPGGQAIEDALATLKGKALHDGGEQSIAVRIAAHDGAIYLDLANPAWEAVQITATGWRVITDAPVKFIRKRGQLALPTPIRGGRVDELRPLLNLKVDESWQLFVAWLVAAMRPGRPFPVLAVNGEQGSAKSTLCKIARNLIDPNKAPLRRPPREERDLMIAATNGWIVAFDNLSGIPVQLSDALCSLATGGGFSSRELYTDADEKLFDATRPVLLNGIEDLATRSDLLDRCLCLTLPTIDEDERQEEEALWLRFEEVRPRVLGALLDAVAMALRNKGTVKLATKPRMADFATWIVAAEPALGWSAGKFLAAYGANRSRSNTSVLDAAVLAVPILALVEAEGIWFGTARELLETLEQERFTNDKTRKKREWPSSPRKLSGDLRRLAPNLRKLGIEVKFAEDLGPEGHTRKGNLIRLGLTGKTPSPPSPRSPLGNGTAPDAGPGEDLERGEGVLQPCPEAPEEIVEWTD